MKKLIEPAIEANGSSAASPQMPEAKHILVRTIVSLEEGIRIAVHQLGMSHFAYQDHRIDRDSKQQLALALLIDLDTGIEGHDYNGVRAKLRDTLS